MGPREHTLSRLLRERGHHLTDPVLFARARAEFHAAEVAVTMTVHDACEAWVEGRLPIERALALTGASCVQDLLVVCDRCEVSRPLIEGPSAWQARRAALKARDAELDAAHAHVPAGGPTDEAGIEAEAVQACREAARDREPLIPISSPRVEAAIKRIMRDTGFTDEQIRGRFPNGDEGP